MSRSLIALPPELISCVVVKIESQSSLCNLARCSRQLYLCVVPHIYRHVTINDEISMVDGQFRNIASLLIRRPDLAGFVREFALHVQWPVPRNPSEESEPKYPKEHIRTKTFKVDQAFKTAVNAWSLSTEEENNWLRQLSDARKCHHDVILPLLLPALLKLEILVLRLIIGYDTHYLERMIRSVTHRERPFDIRPPVMALKIFVHSRGEFDVRRTNFPALGDLFRSLKNKEKIDTLGAVRDTNKDLMDSDRCSSPLTSFDITTYDGSTTDLANLLRAPKALKTFSYKVCSPARIALREIRHALGPQKNCLESLGLECDDYSCNYAGPMTSFTSFNTLKLFKIAAAFLESTDYGTGRHNLMNFFPPNLETLHLTSFEDRYERLLEAVEHLLVQKSAQQIPSLTKLIIEEIPCFPIRPSRLWTGTQETLRRLSRVAAAQGVFLEII